MDIPGYRKIQNEHFTSDVGEINNAVDEYAECVILLFHAYRSLRDLLPIVPDARFLYVMKLRELNEIDDIIGSVGEEKLVFTEKC